MSEADGPSPDPRVGTVIGERYRILRLLGEGSTGAVYQAEHVRIGKPFAVKILHPEMTSFHEVVLRFAQEAMATGAVDHEHLVSATDFGELDGGSLYLVLEFVDGQSLTDLLDGHPLSVERALGIARQVAEALDAVHAAGIVHSDLKPDNVMVVDRDGADFVKVLDFGLARVQLGPAGEDRPEPGSVLGTPRFMSPEQAAGRSVDLRSDLYSLGVLLYTMLAGQPPFTGSDASETLRLHREASPPDLPATVAPEVAALVMRLLAKDPEARMQSARELAVAIEELLGPQVPRSAPVAPARPEQRWSMGAVVAATVLGVVATLLAVALAVGPRAESSPPPAAISSVSAVDVARLLDRAEVGDEAAAEQLEARPDEARSAREWLVLGISRAARGERASALDAYQRAADADEALASERRLLRDVTSATDDAQAWKSGLRVAATLPGPEGADILFRAWASTPNVTDKTALAKKLLETDAVASRASPALRVALALRDADTCEVRNALLGDVLEHGDARVRLPLYKMKSLVGCGEKGNEDCNPCVRGDDRLERALERVAERPAPNFLGG